MAEVPDNSKLRALLFAIERSKKHKDTDLLYKLKNLAPEGTFTDVHIVVQDAAQEIDKEDYRTYDKESVGEARQKLDELAYGNFLEACQHLEYDLRAQMFMNHKNGPDSDEFRSEFFNKDERKIWEKCRREIKRIQTSNITSEDNSHELLSELRLFLERYYGPQIPVTFIGYSLVDEKDMPQKGYSFRAHKLNGKLHVTGYPELTEKVKAALNNQEDLNPPVKIDNLHLSTVSHMLLFEHEL